MSGPDNTVGSLEACVFPEEGGSEPRRTESIFGVSLWGCLEEGEKGHQQAVLFCELGTQFPSCPALSNSPFLKFQIFCEDLQ